MGSIMPSKRQIYLCVDARARDYKFSILVKLISQLWFDDVSVDIFQVNQQVRHTGHGHFDRLGLPYQLYVTGAYNVTRMPDTLSRAYHMRASIVHAHSEQFVNSFLYNEKYNLKRKQEYLRHVKYHLVWSEYTANQLIDLVGVKPENIYLIGNPRLEQMKVDFGDTILSDYLFISDFSLADLTVEEYQNFKKLYQVPSHVNHREFAIQCREGFLGWIILAAQKDTNKVFVIRPHPGENSQIYQDRLKDLPNIKINASDDIDRLIKGTKVCFTYTSSTIFEAIAAGKSFYALKLEEPLPDMLDQPIYDYYPWIDQSQFEEYMQIGFPDNNQNLMREFSYFMCGLDDENTLYSYVLALYDCLISVKAVGEGLTIWDKYRILITDFSILVKDLILKAHFFANHHLGLRIPGVTTKLEKTFQDFYRPEIHFDDVETGYYYHSFLEKFKDTQMPSYKIIQCEKCKKIVYEPDVN